MTLKLSRLGPAAMAAVLVLVMTTSWASAQNTNEGGRPFSGGPGRGRGLGGPGGGPLGLLEPLRLAAAQLGLSETQKDQIKAIAASHADELKGLVDREQQARRALQTAISAPQLNEVTIRQRSAELGAVDADIAVTRARVRAEVFQLLTADQQTTLRQIEARTSEGRGRRGAPGPR